MTYKKQYFSILIQLVTSNNKYPKTRKMAAISQIPRQTPRRNRIYNSLYILPPPPALPPTAKAVRKALVCARAKILIPRHLHHRTQIGATTPRSFFFGFNSFHFRGITVFQFFRVKFSRSFAFFVLFCCGWDGLCLPPSQFFYNFFFSFL